MKKFAAFFTVALLLIGLAIHSKAQSHGTSAIEVTPKVVTPFVIADTADMNFGNVAVNTNPGTVILRTTSSRNKTGGVTLPVDAGTVTAASFEVKGVPSATYTITLPSGATTVTNGSDVMLVDTWVSDPTPTGALDGSGRQTLLVGATMHVAGNQATGVYSSPAPVMIATSTGDIFYARITVTILTSLSMTKNIDMNFGHVDVNANGGSVVLATSGSRSRTGGVTLPVIAGPVSAASFTVTGMPHYTYAITLPNVATLVTSLLDTMMVDMWVSDPTPTGALDGNGTQTLRVGATLLVGANQASGVYTSTPEVIVSGEYNSPAPFMPAAGTSAVCSFAITVTLTSTISSAFDSGRFVQVPTEFAAYPNPAHDKLTLLVTSMGNRSVSWSVYSALGLMMFEDRRALNKSTFSVDVDVRSLNPGLYLLRVMDGTKHITRSFIKY